MQAKLIFPAGNVRFSKQQSTTAQIADHQVAGTMNDSDTTTAKNFYFKPVLFRSEIHIFSSTKHVGKK